MSGVVLSYDFTKTYTTLSPDPRDVDSIPPILGTTFADAAGKQYRFVKNNHSAALVIGDVVFLDKTADYPNAVSQLNTDSCGGVAAGVMGGAAMGAIPAAGYGWIQFAGIGSANVESTTDIVIGDALKGVDSQFYVVKDAALASAATYYNHMRAIAAKTADSAAVVSVAINCRVY